MRKVVLISVAALALGAGAALADQKPSADETQKITAALEALGCKNPEEIEKEDEGHFEIDDAVCADGQYDIKFDKDFKLISKHKE